MPKFFACVVELDETAENDEKLKEALRILGTSSKLVMTPMFSTGATGDKLKLEKIFAATDLARHIIKSDH